VRFLTYKYRNQVAYGAVVDDAIVNLAALMPEYRSLRHVLEADALIRAQDIAVDSSPDCGLGDIEFLPPIPNAQKIACIGVNYGNRNEEYKDDSAAPRYPSVFMRTRESLVGHLQPILRPPESEQLDYEGEIVMVIGKAGRRIPLDQARDHVAGLTLMNEGSVRDWLRHSKFNVTQGKNFEKSGSIGPWMVSSDEIGAFDRLHLTTTVNAEVRQDDGTDNLLFSFEHLISYLSTFMRLQPGDLISTGTPTGAGARFDPPRFLKAGDVVEVEVAGIGKLANTVEDEAL
jgi:2-keto-4-pentenoate hydratase/2-oxohepta-3-ene-1,7-dioic acid hydratase in catechol pathway